MFEIIVCYIPHRLREAYARLPWKLHDFDCHHDANAILAEWIGEGEPIHPPGSPYLRKRENAALLPGAGE